MPRLNTNGDGLPSDVDQHSCGVRNTINDDSFTVLGTTVRYTAYGQQMRGPVARSASSVSPNPIKDLSSVTSEGLLLLRRLFTAENDDISDDELEGLRPFLPTSYACVQYHLRRLGLLESGNKPIEDSPAVFSIPDSDDNDLFEEVLRDH